MIFLHSFSFNNFRCFSAIQQEWKIDRMFETVSKSECTPSSVARAGHLVIFFDKINTYNAQSYELPMRAYAFQVSTQNALHQIHTG